jgi:Raf kinase inhibitor-like YbhB/YbcL family protein
MDTSIFAGIAVVVLQVSSPSFTDNANIPMKFTCEGEGINPAISVKGIPPEAKSLALIVEDPDAPNGTVTHWIAWDMEPTGDIAEKSTAGTQGKNTRNNNGYMGPCPPTGTHHYHFKVYALDKKIGLPEGSTKEQLENEMKDHILASGELIGLYKKSK